MRLFLAIAIPAGIRDAVAAMQNRLRATEADVRWVAPENFHLTVKFLGDHPDTRVPEFEEIAAEAARETDPFALEVRGAGAFPKRGPLRTLWAGVEGDVDAWKSLVRRVEEPLAPYGVAREGGLVPHITLGRVKSPANDAALRAALADEATCECGKFPAGELVLMQSTLDPRGATYTVLRHFPFVK